jgi:hypothetical protein
MEAIFVPTPHGSRIPFKKNANSLKRKELRDRTVSRPVHASPEK